MAGGVDAQPPWRVGDRLPLSPDLFGDCPAEHPAQCILPVRVSCVLDRGHSGQHIAADGEVVIGIWD